MTQNNPSPPSSVYEAIKNDDWEGLLALYAATVYDAVHSAEFARNICGGEQGLDVASSPSSSVQRGRSEDGCARGEGFFFDEKKFERSHSMLASSQSPRHASSIQQLDAIVREILGPSSFDSRRQRFNSILQSGDDSPPQDEAPPPRSSPGSSSSPRQPFKKIRHYSPSPTRKMSLLHRRSSSRDNRTLNQSLRDAEIEKVMWESAAVLSNAPPSPNFVVDRSERARRESVRGKALKSAGEESEAERDPADAARSAPPPLYEGSAANATPGDLSDGGLGFGTAQHLCCSLDSPLPLAVLMVMGADADARHTAFRRGAMHEAACADSPECLGLLMGWAGRFEEEAKASSEDAAGVSSGCASAAASATLAAAAATGFDSHVDCDRASSPPSPSSIADSKSSKMKIPFFSGWGNDKSPRKSKDGATEEMRREEDVASFPDALKIIRDVVKSVRSGDVSEREAADRILDEVGVSSKTKSALASQLGADAEREKADRRRSAALYLYGLARAPQPPRARSNIDGHGNTPLHWASFKNSTRAMDVLLSHGVDVNFRAQPSGWTPLHDAAYSDSAGAVRRLIAAGARVDSRSHSGATPLCFAAQEDAWNATRLLLEAGADPAIRCLGQSPSGVHVRANNADNNVFQSRFSGYTPLHYCAHYNSSRSARVLLNHRADPFRQPLSGVDLLEVPDLNEKLPIHVAVARGSSEVLKELLHGGARVETASYHPPLSPRVRRAVAEVTSPTMSTSPIAIPMLGNRQTIGEAVANVVTPVSSPVLRSLLPSQPINSSKPWNCLSQKSIDACRSLIEEVEQNWTPARHELFSPTDRIAVKEVLRVGKRLEQNGSGMFLELWPFVLSFCGRGWFEVAEEDPGQEIHMYAIEDQSSNEEEMQCSSSDDASDADADFTQFELDGAHDNGNMAML